MEDAVVEALASAVHDDAVIQAFTDRFMEWQASKRGSAVLAGLEDRQRKNEAGIKNILSVIDSGFVKDSLKSHLLEFEAERAEMEAGIAQERMETPEMDRETVLWFLERFRDIDRSDDGWRIFLVGPFLQARHKGAGE